MQNIVNHSYFNSHLNWAVSVMEGYYPEGFFERNGFFQLYPFTTENLCGYFDAFDFQNRSFLTVGSSLDQVILAIFMGCSDVTVYDICPFTKYYFYLKKAGIMVLDYQEFLDYFCYVDYPKTFHDNRHVFNLESYKKLGNALRLLDYESFLFWDELFCNYSNETIRRRLFTRDESKVKVLKNCNLYMRDIENFYQIKKKIQRIQPKFKIGDIYQLDGLGVYDNICLSNLACYVEDLNVYLEFIKNIVGHLSSDGVMQWAYLYDTKRDTKYQEDWQAIYNLEYTFQVFRDYLSEFKSFTGVQGFLFEEEKLMDSTLIYKRVRKEGYYGDFESKS